MFLIASPLVSNQAFLAFASLLLLCARKLFFIYGLDLINKRLNCRKMFIGGLNWETTDGLSSYLFVPFMSNYIVESLKEYFTKFGEVLECTVMRDGPTGRSRGFGFLTFKDPQTVNAVMDQEHFLDGKIVRYL